LQSYQQPPKRTSFITAARSTRFKIRSLQFAAMLAAGLLSGCSTIERVIGPPEQTRGNRVDPDILAELVPGTSSRADVTALLGSPTAKGTFDDNTWLYLGSVTRTRVARKQGIVSLDVVKLTFDEGGVLRGIEHLDMDDRLPVSVVARTTPSPGSDASIMQQLFGNIGRFGVGSSGAAAPGGGSAK
jgi:outer membrane protein assembly factor BamE (lipoprotein component of BamABCDE complex)